MFFNHFSNTWIVIFFIITFSIFFIIFSFQCSKSNVMFEEVGLPHNRQLARRLPFGLAEKQTRAANNYRHVLLDFYFPQSLIQLMSNLLFKIMQAQSLFMVHLVFTRYNLTFGYNMTIGMSILFRRLVLFHSFLFKIMKCAFGCSLHS